MILFSVAGLSYIILDVIGITLLVYILVCMYLNNLKMNLDQKFYVASCCTLVFTFILCILKTIFSDVFFVGPDMVTTNKIINVIYYSFVVVMPCIWLSYVSSLVYGENRHLYRIIPLQIIALVSNVLLAVLSLKYKFYFDIDQTNHLFYGDLIYLSFCIPLSFCLIASIMLVLGRKKINQKVFTIVLSTLLPVLVAIGVQIWLEINVVFLGCCYGFLIVFLKLQNNSAARDYLTNLFNRSEFEKYLSYMLRKDNRNKFMQVGMIDIDKFKLINDQYGHLTGDAALVNAANILTKSFSKKTFIARYAGDEFVFICETNFESDLEANFKNLAVNLKDFNKSNSFSYQLAFSIGTKIIHDYEKMDFDRIMHLVDSKMYDAKAQISSK